ncbi:M15 family metallopeptidase [Amphritea sp.]|uniref:M15 family metallopeptidase n=1 Tax=Amphritea sp. TaxID=1872502 RepID=UPI003A8D726D
MFDHELARLRYCQPSLDDAALFIAATRMVSAVTYPDGSTLLPPHNSGAAVDLFLIDEQGAMLDFGMDIYRWNETDPDPDLCLSHCSTLSEQAMANRRLLANVMSTVGLVNYQQEWWLFSYRDRFWAYLTGHKSALSGAIQPSLD